MFTHVYGLQAVPFTRTLNTNDILVTTSVKELQARLALTVRERSIAVVTGEVGSGVCHEAWRMNGWPQTTTAADSSDHR